MELRARSRETKRGEVLETEQEPMHRTRRQRRGTVYIPDAVELTQGPGTSQIVRSTGEEERTSYKELQQPTMSAVQPNISELLHEAQQKKQQLDAWRQLQTTQQSELDAALARAIHEEEQRQFWVSVKKEDIPSFSPALPLPSSQIIDVDTFTPQPQSALSQYPTPQSSIALLAVAIQGKSSGVPFSSRSLQDRPSLCAGFLGKDTAKLAEVKEEAQFRLAGLPKEEKCCDKRKRLDFLEEEEEENVDDESDDTSSSPSELLTNAKTFIKQYTGVPPQVHWKAVSHPIEKH